MRFDVLRDGTATSVVLDARAEGNASRWVRLQRAQANCFLEAVFVDDGPARILLRCSRSVAAGEPLSISDLHLLSGPRPQQAAAAEPTCVREHSTRPTMQALGGMLGMLLQSKDREGGGEASCAAAPGPDCVCTA